MPRIPTYQESQISGIGLGGRPMSGLDPRQMASMGEAGAGIARTGQALTQLALNFSDMEVQRQKDTAVIEHATITSDFSTELTKRVSDLRETDSANTKKYLDPDYGGTSQPDTHFNQVDKAFNELVNDPKWKHSNRYSQQMWDQYIGQVKGSVAREAIQFEANQRVEARQIGLVEARKLDIIAVAADPAKLEAMITKWETLGNTLDNPETKEIEGYRGVVDNKFLARIKDARGEFAIAAYQTMMTDNPVAAYKSLKALQKDPARLDRLGLDPNEFNKLFREAKSHASAINDYDVYKLETKIDDSIASVAANGRGLFSSKEQLAQEVMRVSDPLGEGKLNLRAKVMIEKAWSQHQEVQATYNITSSLRWLPQDQIVKEVTSLGVSTASDARIKNQVINFSNNIINQRKADPAAYFAEHPTAKNLYAEGKVGEARTMILALQEKAGILEMDRRVLTDLEVANERKWLTSATPNQITERLGTFNQRYGGVDGRYQGQRMMAWRQLTTGEGALPPTYMFAASVMGTSSETAVIQALAINEKTLQDGLGSLSTTGTSFADIKSKSTLIGQQYQKAFTGMLPSRQEVFVNGIQTLATKLAATEVLASGGSLSSDKALHNAYKKLTSAYDVSGGSYFIPKPRVGAANTYVPDAIHKNTSILLQSSGALQRTFGEEKINYPKSKDAGVNLQPEYLLNQYLGTIRNSGYWVNNDTGNGLMLVVQTNAGIEPVTFTSGKRVELSFQQLSTLDIPKNVSNYQRGYLGMKIYPTK